MSVGEKEVEQTEKSEDELQSTTKTNTRSGVLSSISNMVKCAVNALLVE